MTLRAGLTKFREAAIFGLIEYDQWVPLVTLGEYPKTKWLAYKRQARLSSKTDEVMQWDHFVACTIWCRKHLIRLNCNKHACEKLTSKLVLQLDPSTYLALIHSVAG